MRKMDLNLIRPQIAEFTVLDKTFKIMERTIGQTISHAAEYETAVKDLDGLEKKKDLKAYQVRLNAWLLREIQIFIPEFTEKDFLGISETQRAEIVRLIFSSGNEEPTKNEKKSRKGQAGEKS